MLGPFFSFVIVSLVSDLDGYWMGLSRRPFRPAQGGDFTEIFLKNDDLKTLETDTGFTFTEAVKPCFMADFNLDRRMTSPMMDPTDNYLGLTQNAILTCTREDYLVVNLQQSEHI